jgi:gamma-glutamyl:cysteine ligase YbdK (ATP-grasp superfamily)
LEGEEEFEEGTFISRASRLNFKASGLAKTRVRITPERPHGNSPPLLTLYFAQFSRFAIGQTNAGLIDQKNLTATFCPRASRQ